MLVSADLCAILAALAIAAIGNSIGGMSGLKICFAALVFLVASIWTITSHIRSTRKSLLNTSQPLIITSGGIIFPFGALLQLKGRRWRQWEELTNVLIRWEEDSEFNEKDAIILRFKDGCQATIPLVSASYQDIEKFLVSLEMWAPQNAVSSQFSELRAFISPALLAQGIPSYTSLWNDELSRRFNLATFRALPPGTKLQGGRYEISSQLSFGGFSAVYNGVGPRGQLIVIKELSLSHIENPETKDTLLKHIDREAALLSRLNHSHICHLLDTFVERDRQYIVLEKIAGKTLRQMVSESGPMSENVVLRLSLQMAEILTYLHNQSPPLVHRDFTPDNLIVRDGDHLVLIDFNAATEFMSGVTGTVIGRHHYMPPEQIKGKAQPSSDYYSMAGTVSFLLTGKDPRPLSQLNLNAEGLKISPELNDLLASMTKMDHSSRPNLDQIASVLQVCHDRLTKSRH